MVSFAPSMSSAAAASHKLPSSGLTYRTHTWPRKHRGRRCACSTRAWHARTSAPRRQEGRSYKGTTHHLTSFPSRSPPKDSKRWPIAISVRIASISFSKASSWRSVGPMRAGWGHRCSLVPLECVHLSASCSTSSEAVQGRSGCSSDPSPRLQKAGALTVRVE